MLKGLRVAIMVTILSALLQSWVAAPARAELSADMAGKVEAAMQHDTNEAVIAALHELFAANPSLAQEIARAAVDFNAEKSWACAFAAARAVPDQALDIARAMVDEAPEYANDVTAAMSKALPDISDLVAAVVAEAAVGTSAGPAGGPISTPEDTVDRRDNDRASPSG